MAGSEGGLSESRERFFSQAPGQKNGVKLRPCQKFKIIRKIEMDVGLLCNVANVSKSGYYKWLKCADQPANDYEDYLLVKEMHDRSKGKYGWRTIQMKLKTEKNTIMNHKKIQRIKNKYRLFTKIRRVNPYKAIMKRTQEYRTFDNLLNRNFAQTSPYQVFGTDITYLPFNHRMAYLSAVKDFASGKIVAWEASQHLEMDIVLNTVKNMKSNLNIASLANILIHSDQGFHYTNPEYIHKIRELDMVQSMSRKGNCIDNAPHRIIFWTSQRRCRLQRMQDF